MTVPFGTYLEPWEPDEEILASNLNLRERKYGGLFLHDFIGSSDASPVITAATTGDLYGDGQQWGFSLYKAVAGAGLLNDSIAFSDTTISFTTGSTFGVYNTPNLYGFTSYGYANGLIDNLSITDGVPTINIGAIDQQYGDTNAQWGLIQCGYQNGLMTDAVTIDDTTTLTITAAATTPNVYGTSKKYGFCAWQP